MEVIITATLTGLILITGCFFNTFDAFISNTRDLTFYNEDTWIVATAVPTSASSTGFLSPFMLHPSSKHFGHMEEDFPNHCIGVCKLPCGLIPKQNLVKFPILQLIKKNKHCNTCFIKKSIKIPILRNTICHGNIVFDMRPRRFGFSVLIINNVYFL